MDIKIESSWKALLREEFEKEYFINLVNFIKAEYKTQTIYPPGKLIFNAFDRCKVDNLKVVIIGQDPYHGPGQANGLCFSVNEGIKPPPSLVNIFKEINADLGKDIPKSGNLEHWADQGVLMLNATLTVRAHQAGSHQKRGWEDFTDAVISNINEKCNNIVFILWGAFAQKKSDLLDKNKHHIIESAHPSPFSANRGFFGSKPFSKTNSFLKSIDKDEISW